MVTESTFAFFSLGGWNFSNSLSMSRVVNAFLAHNFRCEHDFKGRLRETKFCSTSGKSVTLRNKLSQIMVVLET